MASLMRVLYVIVAVYCVTFAIFGDSLNIALAADADVFLSSHNSARAAVFSGSQMTWNATLAAYAQSYAIHQRDYANCGLVHSGGPYGENLWWGSWSPASPKDAVNGWVAEQAYYNYASNTCAVGKVCGHYTQVVWKNSKSLGCASVACNNNGGTFVICNYYPRGNYIGQKPY